MALDSGGGGGGASFVGLHATSALLLAVDMTIRGAGALARSAVLAGMLAEAGNEAAGVSADTTLRELSRFLSRSAEDVRWRVAVVAGDHGGDAVGFVDFPSAAAARADGARYAVQLEEAITRWWEAYGDDGEAEAAAEYFGLLEGLGDRVDDPAWSAGLVNRLGSDGLWNSMYIAMGASPEDVPTMRANVGPLFAALATAMEHRKAAPEIARDMLDWNPYHLTLTLGFAPAETDFLTVAATRILIDPPSDAYPFGIPDGQTFARVLDALADNPEASFRVVTGEDRHGNPNTGHLVLPWGMESSAEATQALGRVLEVGLVEYPAAHGAREWDLATTATENVMEIVGRRIHTLDDVHPDLNASLAALIRPHVDAIALIAARGYGSTAPGDLAASLPAGRRALDVDLEVVEDYLGATMQQDSGIVAVQLLLAAYSQQPSVQANRLPLLSQDIGSIRELDDFATDSVRIAALAGVVGAGLDRAGHDEESRNRFLIGALNFASGKATGLLPAGRHPAIWLAQRGARYLAGEGIDEIEAWLRDREPIEGEEGVDSFLESYTDTTVASLRDHIAGDPELSQLSASEQEELIDSVRHWVRESVRGPLLEQYAELVGETAGR